MADEAKGLGGRGGVRLPRAVTPWRWNWRAVAERDPTRFLTDVFIRPSVSPVGAWLVSLLIGLVVWLTLRFKDDAAERAGLPHGADPDGLIPEAWGYRTIVIVAALALIAGWEPIVARRLGPSVARWLRPLRTTRAPWVAIPRIMIGAPLALAWRGPSIGLSCLDYLTARPIAWMAGVRWVDVVGPTLSPWLRYATLAFWIVGAAALSLHLSRPGVEPTTLALWCLAPGFLAIVGVVRRWQWVEADREAFLIERGGPAHRRVGFQEDLRDEALTAMVGLFVLIPLALMQVDRLYDAFDLFNADGSPMSAEPTFGQWIGFFGAELAKSVPFVDWSEVFHVANGSPIKAHDESGLGATLVFLLRATLDLLLLAAVLQAVQIAARLRDQNAAFDAGRLDILDPFAELAKFRPLGERNFERLPLLRKLSDAVADFPTYGGEYNERRLAQIVAGQDRDLKDLIVQEGENATPRAPSPVERDEPARDAALLLLAGQHPTGSYTARLLAAIAVKSAVPSGGAQTDRQRRALTLLAEASPQAAREPLETVAGDAEADPALRLLALRELGRLKLARLEGAAARLTTQSSADPLLRAHAGLAVAKAGGAEAGATLEALAPSLTGEAAMAAAYGLGLLARSKEAAAIAARFPEAERSKALRAARSGLGDLDQTVIVPAGEFWMGAADGEDNSQAREYPRHRVRFAAPFGLGVYAVTFEEYDDFCAATGAQTPGDQGWGRDRRPVIDVNWDDAHAYLAWLNAWSGERFRLPSEAEWEYACRAGTTTPFSFGATISTAQANYDGNFTYGAGQKGEYREKTTPVGSFPANGFGLHDMHGNVLEWCADPWHDSHQGAPADGAVWSAGGDASLRVLRGGSWNIIPQLLRSAIRFRDYPAYRDINIGFRLARTVSP